MVVELHRLLCDTHGDKVLTQYFDLAEAEGLCSRLTEKINQTHEHRIIVARHPLLLASIQVIVVLPPALT